MKRFFGILLAVALSFCLLPVFAEGTASETKEPADGWKVIPNYAELCSQIGVGDVLFFNQKPVKIFGTF